MHPLSRYYSVWSLLVSVRTPLPRPDRGLLTRRRGPASTALLLAVVLTCQLMVVLDATIVNIALPDVQAALHFSPENLSWVLNAYTLTFGGLLLLGARAGDILGRKRVFLAGIVMFTLASLAGGFADSGGLLLAARALQGVGGALASPSALALLLTMFPDGRERTRAIGYYTAVSIGGSAVGLIAGGMLTQWVSWRWVLFVNVPIGVAVVLLGRRALPETPRQRDRFDLAGALTSTFGMVALVYGFVHAATDGWANTVTIASFAAGLLLLGAFVGVELRAPSPITPLRLFGDRSRSGSYLARLLLVAGMMGMFFFLTQYLQDVLHYSALRSGFAFLPLTVALFVFSQFSARSLMPRFGARVVMIAGVTISTLGLLWLTQLDAHSSYWSLVGPLVVFGVGNGTAFVPLTTTALAGVEPRDAGAASGLVNVMQQVGGSLGLSVLVTVFGTVSRHALAHPAAGLSPAEARTHAFVVGSGAGFWTAALFLAATLVITVVAIRVPRPEPVDALSEGETDPVPALAVD
ncbi:MAG: MFS transporter [Actinobacteria bacterium]|nr:MFS transporter [Actinomycetota bacterium]